MEFSTLLFIYVFLPLSLIIYYIAPRRIRNSLLLIISMIYCAMYGLRYLIFMSGYTLINYIFGIITAKSGKIRPVSMFSAFLGITADIVIFMLFRSELFTVFPYAERINAIIAPVGLCFLTISSVGYIIDVYKDNSRAIYNLRDYSLFSIMFTKLPMGPAADSASFINMIKQRPDGIYAVGEGIELFVIGLAKKLLLADNLYNLYSAAVSAEVKSMSALSAWLGVIAYMLCLYYTLSGLSDMGQGLSLCFGFRLEKGFDYPAVSLGMNDFAKKWHIPVVSWFEKYFRTPLQNKLSNRILKSLTVISMWILISLWYEVSLNKLICGLIIGISIAAEAINYDRNNAGKSSLIYTFLLLALGAIFFFGENISYSFYYFLAMIGGNNNIADSLSLYFLKNYSVLILVGVLLSTGVRKKLLNNKALAVTESILSPFVIVLLLVLSTVVISYTGVSEGLPVCL